jgi:hypothetical protein
MPGEVASATMMTSSITSGLRVAQLPTYRAAYSERRRPLQRGAKRQRCRLASDEMIAKQAGAGAQAWLEPQLSSSNRRVR